MDREEDPKPKTKVENRDDTIKRKASDEAAKVYLVDLASAELGLKSSPNSHISTAPRRDAKKPDYNWWLKMPYWSIIETMNLVGGLEPRGYLFADTPHEWPEENYLILLEIWPILERHIETLDAGDIYSHDSTISTPAITDFLLERDIPISEEFRRAIRGDEPQSSDDIEEDEIINPRKLTGLLTLINALSKADRSIRYNPENTSNGYQARAQSALADAGLSLSERKVREYLKESEAEVKRQRDKKQ